jgi:hypothetical protein
MIPARYFKENLILVRNITVEDRRFNANVLSTNYNALQVQLRQRWVWFIPSRFQADDTHWPMGCG